MLETARTLLATAVNYKSPVAHADVPMAFIQQDMDTATWIYPPDGVEFSLLNHLRKKFPQSKFALRLMEALYGLKQSPALWNKRADGFMTEQGFTRCTSDSCLYYKGDTITKFALVSLSVDDLLITGNDNDSIKSFRDARGNDNCSSFLGINLQYDLLTGVLMMSCPGKIDALLSKFPGLQKLTASPAPRKSMIPLTTS
mmetsp:Transcript_31178/g.96490  ORF Transcript_31178/g.96490 Transcript_31178/m.96490 type:complete len:199 (+) Transcript_31178:95-691(+)